MNKSRIAGAVIGVSLLLSSGVLFMPTPDSWLLGWFYFHLVMVIAVCYCCLHTGAVLLFLVSLRSYKARLQRAYQAISTAIVLLTLSTIQIVIISAFNWWDSWWVNDGFVVIPYFIAGLMAYFATRNLALLVQVRTVLARSAVVLPIVTVVSLIVIPVPHVAQPVPEIVYDAANVLLFWTAGMYAVAGGVVLAVMRHVGLSYKKTMVSLGWGFITSGIVLFVALVHSFFVEQTQDVSGIIIDALGLISGIIFLYAGYVFAKSTSGTITTVLGMVQYAASLASNPADITPLLTQMRAITDALPPGEAPGLADNQRLVLIYLGIETYLVTREPIRTYTREELRSHFNPILQELLSQHEVSDA